MMRKTLLAFCLTLLALPLAAQQSPQNLVSAYDALADSILGLRRAESSFVTAILNDHYRAAERAFKSDDFEKAAAEMALFANEGDNAVAGIRKRLVEGGHHHNASDGQDGEYESGYVVVTRKAKKNLLEASAALRQASTKDDRMAAWYRFQPIAEKLLGK
ncbi:MAG: hypothetical protein OEM62_08460 [Acidobacteriota bacterium]|nr:hypothetical protein [Acidobacteriota bacterium]